MVMSLLSRPKATRMPSFVIVASSSSSSSSSPQTTTPPVSQVNPSPHPLHSHRRHSSTGNAYFPDVSPPSSLLPSSVSAQSPSPVARSLSAPASVAPLARIFATAVCSNLPPSPSLIFSSSSSSSLPMAPAMTTTSSASSSFSSSSSSSKKSFLHCLRSLPGRRSLPRPGTRAYDRLHPLAQYVAMDEELNSLLRPLMRYPPPSHRTSPYDAAVLHVAHQRHLSCLYSLTRLCLSGPSYGPPPPRPYIDRLPQSDREDLTSEGYCESILFAARAISRGFRIRGVDTQLGGLKPHAIALHTAHETCRWRVREALNAILPRSFLHSPSPHPDHPELYQKHQDDLLSWVHQLRALIGPLLQDFEDRWVEFERRVCSLYFCLDGHHPRCRHRTDRALRAGQHWATVLSSALEDGTLHQDLIDEVHPSIVLALPRLVLLSVLLPSSSSSSSPDPKDDLLSLILSSLLPSSSSTNDSSHPSDPHLISLSSLLPSLSSQDLVHLRRMLVPTEDDHGPQPHPHTCLPSNLLSAYSSICTLADQVHSGPRAKDVPTLLNVALQSLSPPVA
ncbi:MAG: hypothetical protein DHS80DRAFT_32355 [Piptocephalis tieghemiana]|nr:MAG: hypothetical protein DHS80DRAFT_32355 [Piptocephalis tieghemiana]